MKAHIARNQNAGIPLALGWNLSAADRGILEGMAPAFGMKLLLVSPADAGRTVAQLLGEVEVKTTRTLVLEPGAYPPALVLANFKDKDVDTLLDLMKQAQVNIPLKAVVTPTSKSWVIRDLLAHLQEENNAFTAAKEPAKARRPSVFFPPCWRLRSACACWLAAAAPPAPPPPAPPLARSATPPCSMMCSTP